MKRAAASRSVKDGSRIFRKSRASHFHVVRQILKAKEIISVVTRCAGKHRRSSYVLRRNQSDGASFDIAHHPALPFISIENRPVGLARNARRARRSADKFVIALVSIAQS